ncbi:OprO/OprP family phosphate-selective porin [Larsenimonas suaedae]|uniref:OprO/OprP family phosphate-selective porin n=1 Tax=Larsenimonas suaedae TaxID=1851019 RepID=A0ABU1GXZ8_9GAMM|nr:OprO/OprP family phosphate-selective porin [Larsenimonas suaedae]MCM2973429.1 OprO/OprP family phosphate-selective porin [Larsenimonas suaedae]MDR5896322.1 OprO/OprP family phosphate-selective porin [Larsenimonas suaedae]
MRLTPSSCQVRSAFLAVSVSTAMWAGAAQAAPQQGDQATIEALRAQLEQMQQQIDRLERQQSTASTRTPESENVDANAQSSDEPTLAQENSSAIKMLKKSTFTGALELGYVGNDWDEADKDTAGDVNFSKFILGLSGEDGDMSYSFQYRFYDGYRFLHHAWAGYDFSENDTVKLGLVQTPFGNMDYGYLGWYGNLPYLAGFNDNQNAGIKWDHNNGPWSTSLAFFKSDQLGDGNEHYGANPVGSSDQGNTEENQLAGRVAYTFGHGTDYTTELNASLKGGQLYNNNTNDSGSSWQAALGMSGSYGNWLTRFQATAYEFDAENPAGTGISDNVIQIGAFGFNYLIPAKGEMYSASLAYSMDVEWGPIENVYFYNDFSMIDPSDGYSPVNGGFGDVDNPMLNDLGFKLTAGRYYAWFDIVTNKNGLGYFGSPIDNDWHTSVQSHFGLTF